ncbi:MAG: hypothetical protein QOI26_640 [Pseudonocardiales bacterium]|nr:hypothetical protein [Pseudonocardiales bacterium]
MNPRTEERLRAAFEAKAEQVTEDRLDRLATQRRQALLDSPDDWSDAEVPAGLTLFDDRAGTVDDLTPLDLDHRTSGPRHARWLAPVLAAAAVIAVAVGVTAIATVADHHQRTSNPPASQVSTPTPSVTPTPSSTAAPRPSGTATPPAVVQLGQGQQAGRSQIPWSQVGPGWHLAAVPTPSGNGAAVIYLINPIGGRYLISDQLPAKNLLLAWSPDGERALLVRVESSGQHLFTELELATGQLLPTFDPGKDITFISYTRPQGHALLVTTLAGNKRVLQRFGTDGQHQLTYPTTLPGLGRVADFTGLYNSDGSQLLVGVETGIAVLGNDGHLIRSLPAPAMHTRCEPVKWWDEATVLVSCYNNAIKSPDGPPQELFTQPVAGGSPTKLVGASADARFGFGDAWKYSNGVLLHEASSCGPSELDVLRNGVVSKLVLPAGMGSPPVVRAVDGDVVTVQKQGNCRSASGSVVAINIVTGAQTVLFEGTATLISYPDR